MSEWHADMSDRGWLSVSVHPDAGRTQNRPLPFEPHAAESSRRLHGGTLVESA